MAQTLNGLSHEFIIHPGETIKELLDERQISQKELAIRTDVSQAHISKIIHGLIAVSVGFAKRLEYALDVPASFWINLQANYDRELSDFHELHNISAEELAISEKLGSSVAYLKRLNFLDAQADGPHLVIELRRFLKTSNLEQIPNIVQLGAFRLPQTSSVDPYILCSWLRMSELIVEKQPVSSTLDIRKLQDKIAALKGLLFKESPEIALTLKKELSECGIAFSIVRHFEGVPVRGVIRRRIDNTVSWVMTDKNTFADLFWSTFFYEIGRIMHGDIADRLIEYDPTGGIGERNADIYAPALLIDDTLYTEFILTNDFSLPRIRQFSATLNVPSFIVIGRLQRDGHLTCSDYAGEKKQYYFGNGDRKSR